MSNRFREECAQALASLTGLAPENYYTSVDSVISRVVLLAESIQDHCMGESGKFEDGTFGTYPTYNRGAWEALETFLDALYEEDVSTPQVKIEVEYDDEKDSPETIAQNVIQAIRDNVSGGRRAGSIIVRYGLENHVPGIVGQLVADGKTNIDVHRAYLANHVTITYDSP